MQKATSNELFKRLTVQLTELKIPITEDWQAPSSDDTDVIIDGIFGFSFKGWRGEGKDAPFDEIIDFLSAEEHSRATTPPVVAIDIPSGWNVETGPPCCNALRPEMLISLTAPKQCAS